MTTASNPAWDIPVVVQSPTVDHWIDVGSAVDFITRALVDRFPTTLTVTMSDGWIVVSRAGEEVYRVGTKGVEPTGDDWRRVASRLSTL